ncbi:MAG: hypothetical protein ACP5OJ_09370, partial [Methanothermobacter sp.]
MSEKVIKILVASPSDVVAERMELERIIKRLNDTWSNFMGIRFDLLKWETHSIPGIDKDPQKLISKQMGNDYDIFLGILWTKFGTPTTTHESGTEEEFEKAYQRYLKGENVEIMMYFKDSPLSPSEINPVQHC